MFGAGRPGTTGGRQGAAQGRAETDENAPLDPAPSSPAAPPKLDLLSLRPEIRIPAHPRVLSSLRQAPSLQDRRVVWTEFHQIELPSHTDFAFEDDGEQPMIALSSATSFMEQLLLMLDQRDEEREKVWKEKLDARDKARDQDWQKKLNEAVGAEQARAERAEAQLAPLLREAGRTYLLDQYENLKEFLRAYFLDVRQILTIHQQPYYGPNNHLLEHLRHSYSPQQRLTLGLYPEQLALASLATVVVYNVAGDLRHPEAHGSPSHESFIRHTMPLVGEPWARVILSRLIRFEVFIDVWDENGIRQTRQAFSGANLLPSPTPVSDIDRATSSFYSHFLAFWQSNSFAFDELSEWTRRYFLFFLQWCVH